MTYSEKLKDPRWQKRRLKVMEYAHCHHSYYTKGKEPWEYPDGAIICICEKCHRLIHPEKRIAEDLVMQPAPFEKNRLRLAEIRKLLEGIGNGR